MSVQGSGLRELVLVFARCRDIGFHNQGTMDYLERVLQELPGVHITVVGLEDFGLTYFRVKRLLDTTFAGLELRSRAEHHRALGEHQWVVEMQDEGGYTLGGPIL
jgi:hypothetical protein